VAYSAIACDVCDELQALGAEFCAKGDMILGPSINIHRVPKNGRSAEYISGEDAYFGSKLIPEHVVKLLRVPFLLAKRLLVA
jgi:beta-glucosidase-like glycosyl hydrolase